MSKEKRRVPKLRFPGFTEDWEQRKLGENLIQYTEITTQNNQYPVLTSSRKGLFFQTDYYDGNQIASKDNTGYNIVPFGYFTYRHMSDDEIFHFNINYLVDKGIVSTLYPVFTTKNLNSDFLQLQLNYGTEFKKYAVLLKQGGSRTYMYFNKLKDFELTISTSIDEQKKISEFFILFEKLITLHQRKLDNLKLKKKALLQKLFPKNGERYPELRFLGFTDAWEQRKLSDILKVNSGKDYKHLDQGNIPVYGTGGYMLSVNESLSNIDAIGIGRKGTIDKPQYLKAPFWTVDTLFYLTALDKHSILFLYYLMQLIPWKKFDESTGVPSLSKTTIDNISGFVPSNSQEEELISALFNQLDKSITLHQRKLDHLQFQKKALLQQMFV